MADGLVSSGSGIVGFPIAWLGSVIPLAFGILRLNQFVYLNWISRFDLDIILTFWKNIKCVLTSNSVWSSIDQKTLCGWLDMKIQLVTNSCYSTGNRKVQISPTVHVGDYAACQCVWRSRGNVRVQVSFSGSLVFQSRGDLVWLEWAYIISNKSSVLPREVACVYQNCSR